jgi:hypothetical protein
MTNVMMTDMSNMHSPHSVLMSHEKKRLPGVTHPTRDDAVTGRALPCTTGKTELARQEPVCDSVFRVDH